LARPFDLNIEKILEHWDVHDAIREVIANAIDEQQLTHTKDIEIRQTSQGTWVIRDYGRGLKVEHLTQNENKEKLANLNMIGKFGIGLKDALATFYRHNVKVSIQSKFNDFTLGMFSKAGFEGIKTLHAMVEDHTSDSEMVGTRVELAGVTEQDVERAKDLFLRFSGEKELDSTEAGEVLEKKGDEARIYINGVKVAEEANFLFSYNITSLTGALRRALNRERTNVGRTAYQERVKKILISSESKAVAERLTDDLREIERGNQHDELQWIDVQEHAVRILNTTGKMVFMTSQELINDTMMVDEARLMGYKIVTVPEKLDERIKGLTDVDGNSIVELTRFGAIYMESFKFKFVEPDKLTKEERAVFEKTDAIMSLVGGRPKQLKEIKISETMRPALGTLIQTEGLWEAVEGRIIIKRSALKEVELYAGVLIHELTHVLGGAPDVSREFEDGLTLMTGHTGARALSFEGKK
jgi:hypothetical protein